jgi:hypothetical protein
MSNDLSEWIKYTAVLMPLCKTDVEIGAKRLFDAFNFKAGKSQKDRRRSFEEVWESSNGNPEAIAYGFDAAIKAKVYTIAYVKACIKNLFIENSPKPEPYKLNTPKTKPNPEKSQVRASRKPKVKTNDPVEDVKVDWS